MMKKDLVLHVFGHTQQNNWYKAQKLHTTAQVFLGKFKAKSKKDAASGWNCKHAEVTFNNFLRE